MVGTTTNSSALNRLGLHIYVWGLRGLELALTEIARAHGQDWLALRDAMREDGRLHSEAC